MANIPTFLLRSLGKGLTEEEVYQQQVKQMTESNRENPVDTATARPAAPWYAAIRKLVMRAWRVRPR